MGNRNGQGAWAKHPGSVLEFKVAMRFDSHKGVVALAAPFRE
jgi:hypothetical protein